MLLSRKHTIIGGIKVDDQRNTYDEKLSVVKEILETMVDMENGFSCLEEYEDKYASSDMWWETESAEIKVNDILDDTYYITICITPIIEAKRGRPKCCINYYYTIVEQNIERDLTLTLDTPSLKDYGEKVLDELVSILNSGNLKLARRKNINAP
jgi:hypothetical protein